MGSPGRLADRVSRPYEGVMWGRSRTVKHGVAGSRRGHREIDPAFPVRDNWSGAESSGKRVWPLQTSHMRRGLLLIASLLAYAPAWAQPVNQPQPSPVLAFTDLSRGGRSGN